METRLGHALASVDGWRARTGDIGFVVMEEIRARTLST
jgi:hypothetical protein